MAMSDDQFKDFLLNKLDSLHRFYGLPPVSTFKIKNKSIADLKRYITIAQTTYKSSV
jgi:hypothetical protein